MPAVHCRGVWKRFRLYTQRSHSLKERLLTGRNAYNELWAVRGVELEVPSGSSIGLIGANGSGKSTLLRCIARIYEPERGTVRTTGRVAALLELGTGFHPDLTGRENVSLGGSLLGLSRRQIAKSFDEIVAFADLEAFIDTPFKHYSSGMQTRLAFSLATTVESDVLLLDEVLAVGDEQFQMKCHERLADFRAQGRTIVLVSHSLDAIRALCEDAVWLDHGQMRASGPSDEVAAAYLESVRENMEFAPTAQGRRYGTGDIRITSVEMLDQDGRKVPAFRTGRPLRIRMTLQPRDRPVETAIGVAFHSPDVDAPIFGYNTHEAGLRLVVDRPITATFEIPSLPLLRGAYQLSVALQPVGGDEPHDWHDRRYSFFVFDDPDAPRGSGLVRMDGRWRVTSA